MYRWLRNSHLYLGLFSCVFVLMYGISSVQMAHPAWFNNRPAVNESTVAVAAGAGADARVLARELMDRHGMRGELTALKQTPDGFAFRIVRPGTVYEVDYAHDTSEARVRTNVANFIGMMNRLHHIAGLWHEFSLTNMWGAYLGVVSLALILLGLSGLYLWFKIHTERRIGVILLALNLVYSLTLMVWMRLA